MKKNTVFISFICILTLFNLVGCGLHAPSVTDIDPTDPAAPDAVICADLVDFPQDLTAYAERIGAERLLLSAERQAEADARFDRLFFAPWTQKHPSVVAETAFEAVTFMNPAAGYAENLRPIDPARWKAVIANADLAGYAGKKGTLIPAIMVKNGHLRRLPTDMPFFLYPRRAGEGFPFDYLQTSLLGIGSPVGIIHRSRDGAWVYVESALVHGWTLAENAAQVDAAFMRRWQEAPLAAVLREGVRLYDPAQPDLVPAFASIGVVLPLKDAARNDDSPALLYPVRALDGQALIRTARLEPGDAAKKPLPLTPGALAAVGNRMLGQPYGWGGMFGNRDCSSAMRDLFTPFGLWLPRNSQAQGRLGEQVDLAGLTPDEKETRIMAKGVPFASLVRLRGHIGLYLGTYPKAGKEVPVMFHSLWGLRVLDPAHSDKDGKPLAGRAVIGRAAVTSLRPGAELPLIASPASLLDRIDGLAVLSGERAE